MAESAQQTSTTAAPVLTATIDASAPPPPEPKKPSAIQPEFIFTIIIIIAAFIFLIQRPEKKAREEKLKALEGLKKGDDVISTGGIHGVVQRVNKDKGTVFVTVAKGVEMEFSKGALNAAPEVKEAAPTAAKAKA